MSRKGDCWDTAVVESFFGTLKTELEEEVWASNQETREAIREYINELYNPVRKHSANGYLSPTLKEQRFRQNQRLAA
ncbi:MAG: putative transposase [Myxococcota bacterium]|jgi:putative transposase